MEIIGWKIYKKAGKRGKDTEIRVSKKKDSEIWEGWKHQTDKNRRNAYNQEH